VRVAIAGAGLGGLRLAQGLPRAGIDTEVSERAGIDAEVSERAEARGPGGVLGRLVAAVANRPNRWSRRPD
jgi:2-polyprenyl-6-methoxyphenol hydroxylase-like FAD-dependent oxidoreductase